MKFTATQTEACRRVFFVELDAPEVRLMRSHALEHVAARADLPGFRKGKVPEQVLMQRFGKTVEEETIQEAVSHAARHVLAETRLQPATNPTVKEIRRAGEGMAFDLTIELAPEVSVGEYKGYHLQRDAVFVRPEDVDAVIEGLRRRQAVHVRADRPARWGDLCVIDYEGTVDGRPFEGSASKDVLVAIGSGEAMRDLESGLVGMGSGSSATLRVAYPIDHVNSALAGKIAELAVTVKEVKVSRLPELDDRFARAAGEYASLEALRVAVAARLRAEREREAQVRLRARVTDRLLRFAPPEATPTMVEDEMQAMAVRGAEELARQGIRAIEQMRMKPEQFREMFRPAANRAVREAFVLEEISRREGIAVTDEQLEAEIRDSAGGGRALPERTVTVLKADGRWDRLRRRLQQDRTLVWIIGQATVTEQSLRI
ncbi:MAG: trigger factor [bacterium]